MLFISYSVREKWTLSPGLASARALSLPEPTCSVRTGETPNKLWFTSVLANIRWEPRVVRLMGLRVGWRPELAVEVGATGRMC